MASSICRTIFGAILILTLLGSTTGASKEAPAALASPLAAVGPRWSTPQNVSSSSTVPSDAPTLVVTATGTVHFVWEEGDQLYHRYRAKGSWSSPAQIPGTGSADQPSLAAGPLDEAQLVYANYPDVYHISWDGSKWSLPRNVSQHSIGASVSPDVAVEADGSITIVAVEVTSEQLYLAEVNAGSYLPIPNAGYGESPSLAVADPPARTFQVAYRNTIGADIYTMRRAAGIWSLPQAVSDVTGQFSTAPEVALDVQGRAHVAWRETIVDTPQVQYAYGPGWTELITLSQSASGTTSPGFALDALGGRHATWGDGSTPPFSLRHTWSDAEGAWSTPQDARLAVAEVDDVALFASANGVVHAAWVEGEIGEVWYASLARVQTFLPVVLRH